MKKLLLAVGLLCIGDSYAFPPVEFPYTVENELTRFIQKNPKLASEIGEWRILPQKQMKSSGQEQNGLFTGGTYIMYTDGSNAIELSELIPADVFYQILWHEIGHHMWHTRLTKRQQQMYNRVYKKEQACITQNACTNSRENFAEWWVAFYKDKRKSKGNKVFQKSQEHQRFFTLFFDKLYK